MNEEIQESRQDDEQPVVVVVDTLDRTELVRRRKVSPELERWANLFGYES